MNILYIDHYAGSLSMGMEFRPYYLAREWKKLGHTVRIIGADYSHLRKNNPSVVAWSIGNEMGYSPAAFLRCGGLLSRDH